MVKIDKFQVHAMIAALDEAERPIILTHARPDGDALGSSLGLCRYLKSKGKRPEIILADKYPDTLSFIPENEEKDMILIHETGSEAAEKAIAEADLIFCLDFNSFGRTEKLSDALQASAAPKILIDHHLYPDRSQFSTVFSETEISSTSELLYYILLKMPEIEGNARRLPPGVGKALLTGMTTDTNNFSNSTFPSTFAMASELLAAGVDRDGIIANLYSRYRENRIRLLGHLLDSNLKITGDGVAYMIIDKGTAEKFGIREGETEGFVNIPLGIDRVRMSVLAKEDEDRFRISIRSKTGISANRFASTYFNGGGHENASGGKLIFGTDIANDTAVLEKYIGDSAKEFMTGQKDDEK